MNIENLNYFTSPVTRNSLNLKEPVAKQRSLSNAVLVDAKSKQEFQIQDGIICFINSSGLNGTDKDFNNKYQKNSQLYDEGMDWLFNSFYEKEDDVRKKLIAPLHLKSDSFVLNVGCGTGSDSIYISKKLGSKGKLFNLDLSINLLSQAKEKLSSSKISNEFIVANGSNLPFPDNTFDCVFHFGGINMFSEKKRAIAEMVRVTKPNGRIVFGDESAAPWMRKKLFGKIIINANPLYKHQPPIHLLPLNAKEVSIDYVLGSSFYLISFTKGKEAKLNLDLKIPGKRGGTLNSRYENSLALKKKKNDK